jgi:hypothetical protein
MVSTEAILRQQQTPGDFEQKGDVDPMELGYRTPPLQAPCGAEYFNRSIAFATVLDIDPVVISTAQA